jgi:hypothetical protein
MAVFWLVAPIALMMEAARTSETLVNVCQTTRRHNPEDSHLHNRRRENLKSYRVVFICSLFNDAVSGSDYIASNNDNELETIWKEAAVASNIPVFLLKD